MCSTGLPIHQTHAPETLHAVHPLSSYLASDFDPANQSSWTYFTKPHYAGHVTSTEKTPNQQGIVHHHWELPHLPFRRHSKQAHGTTYNVPDVDIRETKTAYYFDIELPGVGDKKSISIKWTSSRSFVVEGLIGRLEVEGSQDVKAEGGQDVNAEGSQDNKAEESHSHAEKEENNDAKISPLPSISYTNGIAIDKTKQQPWHDVVTLQERRIGAFRRSFNVSCDVDNKELRAKLQDGLLSIKVPKSEHEHGLDWKPEIE